MLMATLRKWTLVTNKSLFWSFKSPDKDLVIFFASASKGFSGPKKKPIKRTQEFWGAQKMGVRQNEDISFLVQLESVLLVFRHFKLGISYRVLWLWFGPGARKWHLHTERIRPRPRPNFWVSRGLGDNFQLHRTFGPDNQLIIMIE